jgi:hypothetical protein
LADAHRAIYQPRSFDPSGGRAVKFKGPLLAPIEALADACSERVELSPGRGTGSIQGLKLL